MPLYWAGGRVKAHPRQRSFRKRKSVARSGRTNDDGSVVPLARLCLLSLADNMKDIWVKDYADNYMDQYAFRYIMGPFNYLPGELVEELIWLLCTTKQMSRAALHLLLLPQLRGLSLDNCPNLVNSSLCFHIAARCEGLWSLDLSGAQQLSSNVLSQTIGTLPNLRFLSLTGTRCDGSVVKTIARCCRYLRHLDISRCHFIPPSALFLLGCGASSLSPDCRFKESSPSQYSCSTTLSASSLRSLFALDIGFGEEEGEPVAAAAYLLLSLPVLEKVALDGLSQACRLIQRREFSQTDKFTKQEGVPRLVDLFRERRRMQATDSRRGKRERAAADEEDEETLLWEGFEGECEEESSGDEGPSCSQRQEQSEVLSQSDDEGLILCLKEVKSWSCDCLDSLSQLCPNLCSISVHIGDDEGAREGRQGSLLVRGLQTWSGRLCSLSVHYSGPLVDLFPAMEVIGSSLLSLTLEGMKTSPYDPLLDLIKACPRLRELHITAEPPFYIHHNEDDEENQRNDLPRLPNLRSLSLKFSYEHSQMAIIKSWMSLSKVIKCLLTGSPLLERISLVSLPCVLNRTLCQLLGREPFYPRFPVLANPSALPLMPLEQAQHIEVPRTDVQTSTVHRLLQQCKRLKYLDVSKCWNITQQDWSAWRTHKRVTIIWS